MIVGARNMQHQMAETHLLRGWLVAELVSRHFVDCRNEVLLLTRKDLTHCRGHGILCLRESSRAHEQEKNTCYFFHRTNSLLQYRIRTADSSPVLSTNTAATGSE